MKNPLISIITVVYNGEKHIERTINSVLSQMYSNVEYIIIDGASKDNTLSIIKKYEDKITQFISEKDSGIYNAMNKGLALAKGEIIGILNADDYYFENTLQQVVDVFLTSQADIVYGNIVKLRTIQNKDYLKEIAPNISLIERTMPIFHPATFVKKTVYKKIGNFNEKYQLAADYDFIYRAYKNNINFEYIPQPLTVFRVDGISSVNCQSYKEGYKILVTHGSPYDREMKRLVLKCKFKIIFRTIFNFFISIFGLKKWNENRLIKKWK